MPIVDHQIIGDHVYQGEPSPKPSRGKWVMGNTILETREPYLPLLF